MPFLLSSSLNLNNIFCVGNDYVKIDADNLDFDSSGNNHIWDFSNAIITENNIKFSQISINDSVFDIIEPKGRYKYLIRKDSLFWIGYENRTTKLYDSISPLVANKPLSYNQTNSSPYIFNGRYSSEFYMVECGNISTVHDGKGTLILPSDTLTDVLRTKEVKNFHAKISKDVINLPLDTISDTIPLQRRITYRWYFSRYNYPVAEIRQDQIYDMGTLVYEDKYGYILTGNLLPIKQKEKKEENENSQPTAISININNQNSIDISFEIESTDAIVEISITDTLGRIYAHSPATKYPRGIHSINIPISGIPQGDYLILTVIDGISSEKQFININ